MDEQQVEATLRPLDDGRWITPNRVRWLARLSQIYEAQDVLAAGRAPALHRACPAADSCWDGEWNRASAAADTAWQGDEDGSIFWPWVGEGYRRGGVCIIGWNIHHGGEWWSIAVEYAIAAAQNQHLAQGGRQMPGGSRFAYRTAASSLAVLASLQGEEPVESPDPKQGPETLERVARLQAVKCSPLRDRSRPTRQMCANCPPRYLARELDVLAPNVVIAFGAEARSSLEGAGSIDWQEETRGYRRGTFSAAEGSPAQVFALYHPSVRQWPVAQRALIASLQQRPLRELAT